MIMNMFNFSNSSNELVYLQNENNSNSTSFKNSKLSQCIKDGKNILLSHVPDSNGSITYSMSYTSGIAYIISMFIVIDRKRVNILSLKNDQFGIDGLTNGTMLFSFSISNDSISVVNNTGLMGYTFNFLGSRYYTISCF